MTKRRLPLTFENALTRIAGELGWTKVAEICGVQERACRNWSDPDTTQAISMEAALRLDVAFHAAGGQGSPFLQCYATRLDAEQLAANPGRERLLECAGRASKEAGEAIAAALAAAMPGAHPADFVVGEKELEEAIDALTHTLAALKARRAHADHVGEPAVGWPAGATETRAPDTS